MPTYEYKCEKCLFQFEVRRGFSDNGATFCPSCGSEAHRLFSPVPIIFKGPGFYVTDSRKDHERPWSEDKADKLPSGEKEK